MSSSEGSWIPSFCDRPGNEFFCEVDESFIIDRSNLIGLKDQVPHYEYALELILGLDPDEDEARARLSQSMIGEQVTQTLYGLIHARYILTGGGIDQMMIKWRNGDFGFCPRFYCEKQNLLPVGISDIPKVSTVKLFCPSCVDIYTPINEYHQEIDGAFFGTGFPHMFFFEHPELKPRRSVINFVPRLFGFKIHPTVYGSQQT
ncbi:casein kinase II, putaitve [Brugia malayi]|uniref:Casein kinase II subunit beta n=2 Tax=Brugia TaxID=6278 RepID=A0A0K0K0B3_BRUMA|nr:casein kinase II, putative [Brugia malayi]CTP81208.1 Bm9735 [Brugia malayi]VIO93560.1 casein kinase II, putaitve [Brugia malayi]